MSTSKSANGILEKVLVPLLVALLVGGTAPWWWNRLIERKSLPLQIGDYFVGSTFVSILQKGERFCIVGGSKHGTNIASVFLDPRGSNLYQVHGYRGWNLSQKDFSTIVFGGSEYKSEDGLGIPDPSQFGYANDIENCLTSSDPFFVNHPGYYESQ